MHLCFKALTGFLYITSGVFELILSKTIVTFILLILSVLDFWFVKNISGRKLVGLKWWSEVNEKMEDDWYFECYVDEKYVN